MKSAFDSRKTASTEAEGAKDNRERPPVRNLLLGGTNILSKHQDLQDDPQGVIELSKPSSYSSKSESLLSVTSSGVLQLFHRKEFCMYCMQ